MAILNVDPSSSVPIFEQIVRQVKYAVARGAYRPGDRLPSVRQLALDALVNPNTVAKAYRELEREDIVRTRRGSGIFVADGAKALCSRDGRSVINHRVQEVIDEAAQTGMTPDEMQKVFRKHMNRRFRRRR